MSVNFEQQRDITSLLSTYARSVDAADAAAVLECFTADVSLSFDGGRLIFNSRADAEDFYHRMLRGSSTHQLGNFGFERSDDAVVVNCSALVFTCQKQGFVTIKDIFYVFRCVGAGSGLRIQKLEHSSRWECDAPGGPR